MDPHLMDQVAGKVLRESLSVREGETVTIETWNTGVEFAKRTAVRARRMGALPLVLFEDEDAYVEGLRQTPSACVGKMGRHEYALLSETQAYVFIPGPVLGGSSRISRRQVTTSTAYNPSWYKAAEKARLRGVRMTFGYVGEELAQILHRTRGRIVEHQLKGSLANFSRIRRRGLGLSHRLRPGAKVIVTAEEETLRFQLGREDALDDGVVTRQDLATGGNMTNMPPGYYAREIVPSSLTGVIRVYAPVPRVGSVADLRLEFRNGRLVSWESAADRRWLNRLVADTPKDRRRLAALVIGLNPALHAGYGQDRLMEGAVTFSGMFQGTTRAATVQVHGEPVVQESVLAPDSRDA